eukprot:5105046-Alexandrium_andersonii.AAC.1
MRVLLRARPSSVAHHIFRSAAWATRHWSLAVTVCSEAPIMHAMPAREGPPAPLGYWTSTFDAVADVRDGLVQQDRGTRSVGAVLGVLNQARDNLRLAAALRARQPVCHKVPHALRRSAGGLSGWAPGARARV